MVPAVGPDAHVLPTSLSQMVDAVAIWKEAGEEPGDPAGYPWCFVARSHISR